MTNFSTFRNIAVATTVVLITACASTPDVPQEQYQTVRIAIDEALEIDANSYAGEEMLAAQRKLSEAETAEQSGNGDRAIQLLEEAHLHAEFAQISARQGQAQETLAEINAVLSTLESELAR